MMASLPTFPAPILTETSPSGNFAQLLNDTNKVSSAALNTVSDLFGTIADISAVVGVAFAIYSIVESALGQTSDVQVAIQALAEAIEKDFKLLNQDLGVGERLQRNTTLNQAISVPLAKLQTLPASLKAQPPLSAAERTSQIAECLAALNALNGQNTPNTIWDLTYDWQVYWTDAGAQWTTKWFWPPPQIVLPPAPPAPPLVFKSGIPVDIGYGLQQPPKNADGSVFSYNYALSSYLFAAGLFVAVGGALDPAFAKNYAANLNACIATLQQVHDRIVNTGMKVLFPAPFTPGYWIIASARDGNRGLKDVDPTQPSYPWVDAGAPSVWDGAILYFGAVEMYSGASEMVADYQMVIDLRPGNDQTVNNRDAAWNKATLKAQALSKKLYVDIGLSIVVKCILDLKGVMGQQPPAAARFCDWSIRHDVIPTMKFAPGGGGYSVRGLAKFLSAIPPADAVTNGQFSLRQLLSTP